MNRRERRRQAKAAARSRPADALVAQAVAHLQAGRAADAEALLRRAVDGQPDHADALHVLGLAVHQSGRTGEAADLLARAAAAPGAGPAIHANRAALLNGLGRSEEAEAAARRALALDPGHAPALNNLAAALQGQGRPEAAADASRQALALDPDYADAAVNLGHACRVLGHLDESVAAYRRAVALAPANATAHAALGTALREGGAVDEAQAACRRAVDLAPSSPDAYNALGTVLQAAGATAAAIDCFETAVGLAPQAAEPHLNLAAALYAAEDLDGAAAAYRRVIDAHPGLAPAHNGLGVVLLAAGELEEAAACFRRAVTLDPEMAEAWSNLAGAATADLGDAEVAALETLLAAGAGTPGDRAALHFALAEIEDRRGHWDAAFAHARAANALRREHLAAAGHVFDADAHDRWVDRVIAAAVPESPPAGGASEVPVFVVGMPRSGTTLVEQIAASHPDVFGAGELDAVAALDRPEAPPTAAADHLRRLAELSGGAPRVVDKTPFNFLHLGAIAALFPGARVVHCRRDRRDLALSCYFQNFTAPHPWATDLGDIARYHAAYVRLMDHWRRVVPLSLLEVDYEALVADVEGESRRLIAFLGLPWDDACLSFHQTRRPVRTASAWQVRRPVYGGSVGRWRNYTDGLGPVLEDLAETEHCCPV